ncbi:hypothetical protein PCASD_11258 [Puccinia coronata f. sp. avenae]|uniref:Extracellular membrane protein CFEM domain-containing protein n=1 Tax=Puccinia coronata f. sp. avenae TaxID=200324 RepID=A0A2N5UJ95_9BASI|nr:hypothetical protein PCASD_11258 [Puccinia coronata f. sp. avenae]
MLEELLIILPVFFQVDTPYNLSFSSILCPSSSSFLDPAALESLLNFKRFHAPTYHELPYRNEPTSGFLIVFIPLLSTISTTTRSHASGRPNFGLVHGTSTLVRLYLLRSLDVIAVFLPRILMMRSPLGACQPLVILDRPVIDLKCICKQPNLVAANKDCFSKECDLNSLSKALKLIAACQESFGITPTPAVESKPAAPPSLQPPTGYIGYPYMTIPPTPEQSPSAPYYAYPYPGPRVVAPISNSAGVALPPGTTVPPVGSSPPAAAPQPQVQPQVVAPPVQASATPTPSPVNSTQASAPTTQASAPAPQGSFPKSQTPAPIGGANNGTWNSSGPNPAASASNASSLSASNASASRTAGDSAWGSG